MDKEPQYTNLEIEVNFTSGKTAEIIEEITKLLAKHGWNHFAHEMGMDESGYYYREKVVFYPKECIT